MLAGSWRSGRVRWLGAWAEQREDFSAPGTTLSTSSTTPRLPSAHCRRRPTAALTRNIHSRSFIAAMRLSHAIASLILLTPAFAAVAPPATQCGLPFHAPCYDNAPRPWRRISDAIIRKIWGISEKQHAVGAQVGDTPLAGTPSSKLLARYGQDIVMRFTIRTADEASALAEAADVLFLDVWEFNDNWVDIRIAKDVVRRARDTTRLFTDTFTGPFTARPPPTISPDVSRCLDAGLRTHTGHLRFLPVPPFLHTVSQRPLFFS